MSQIDWNNPILKNIPNIIAVIVLLLVLSFILVRFGWVRCCEIPGFCGIYYGIAGSPQIAIIYGEDSYQVGNPQLLQSSFIRRKNIFPVMYPIDAIMSSDLLNQFAVVFVEAKQIDTATLQRFKNYVSKGGKLVWIGDSGTVLGDEDYICQKVTFKYLPATVGYGSEMCEVLQICEETDKETGECTKRGGEEYNYCINHQCSALEGEAKQICESVSAGKTPADSWYEYSPDDPYKFKAGLCAKTFGGIVAKFNKEKTELYAKLTTGGMSLYDKDSFKVEGAENIEACIDLLGKEVTSINADTLCHYDPAKYNYGANYWNRGPSETLTGEKVPAINFANVLGIDIISLSKEENLNLVPVMAKHPLIEGYESEAYFGTAPLTRISITRFPVRSNTIMSVKFGKKDWWPAIVVSNPTGPALSGHGLVAYFAFPPEWNLEDAKSGRGANLINNLINFALCQ